MTIQSHARSLFPACSLLVVGLAAFLPGVARSATRTPAKVLTSSADTTTVWGPGKWVKGSPSNQFTYDTDSFQSDTTWAQRFVLEIWNTNCSAVTVVVDGQQWIGSTEVGFSTTQVLRTIDLGAGSNHSVTIGLNGAAGKYIWARIVRVREPAFIVRPDTLFVRGASVPDTQYTYFNVTDLTQTPFTMRVINGSPNGTNRTTNAVIKLNGTTVLSSFSTGVATSTFNVNVLSSNTVMVINSGAASTRVRVRVVGTDHTAPILSITQPPTTDTVFTNQPTYTLIGSVTVADEAPGNLQITDVTPWLPPTNRALVQTPGSFSTALSLTQGRHTLRLQVTNGATLSTSLYYRSIVRDSTPPMLNITYPSANAIPDSTTDSLLTINGNWNDSTYTTVTVDGVVVATGYKSPGNTLSTGYRLDVGMNRIAFSATDVLHNTTSFVRYCYRKVVASEPANPPLIYSPLSPTVLTPFFDSVQFLWTGSNPVQVGATGTAFQAAQVGVIRGHVIGRDYGPLQNVTVSVLGHSEFGTTLTRQDGTFDLAVNGGQRYALRFYKFRHLDVERSIDVPVNDYAILDDVAVLGVTAHVDTVNLDSPNVVRSRFSTDANGDRDMRIIFRPGTRAKVVRAPGDTISTPLSLIHVRATEYTVGPYGRASMPGDMPLSTAYTYCVDIRTDEAEAVANSQALPFGGTVFTDTLACYVPNFLHFPVGGQVPIGFYDPAGAKWQAESDGRVIKIIGDSAGVFQIDSDNDQHADGPAQLTALGITSNELSQLRTQFAVGDTVWRISTTHFSRPDINPSYGGLSAAASAFADRALKPVIDFVKACLGLGSIIECEGRVLRERIPVAGTPYTLNYRSARAQGDHAVRSVHVREFSQAPSVYLSSVVVQLDVAGQRIQLRRNYPFSIDDAVDLTWNGKDAYGRVVRGSVVARVGVGYQYQMLLKTGGAQQSWDNAAVATGPTQNGYGERSDGMTVWSYQRVVLGAADAGSDALGGWSISPHHFYDPKRSGVVYFGDGSVLTGDQMPPTATLYAGTGAYCDFNLGQCTITSQAMTSFIKVTGMAKGADGSLYVADKIHGSIYRIARDGTISRFAGTGTSGAFDNPSDALHCRLTNIVDLATGPDGSVYFVCNYVGAEPRISTNGLVGRVIGGMVQVIVSGTYGYEATGDGGPVSNATVANPTAISVGPDGSVFVADMYISPTQWARIRRITPDGRIVAYAGKGVEGSNPPSNKATDITMTSASHMAVDADGTLYVTEGARTRLWRITADGWARRIVDGAGTGLSGVVVAPDGGVYIGDYGSAAVYAVSPEGTVSRIAGGGAAPFSTNLPITACQLPYTPGAMVVDDDGSYYLETGLQSFGTSQIWRIARTLGTTNAGEYAIADPNGSAVHYFGLDGRHLRTRDPLTGAVLYSFGYDPAGRLLTITDVNGDVTTITRDGSGVAQGIVGPFGQTTSVTFENGLLKTASLASGVYTMSYSTDTSTVGLLTDFVDPALHDHAFHYDGTGRLDKDTDPESNYQTLTAAPIVGQTRAVTRTSPELRRTVYTNTSQNSGASQRDVTASDLTHSTAATDSSLVITTYTNPDGLARQATVSADPLLKLIAPYLARATDVLPVSGLARSVTGMRYVNPSNFNPPSVTGTWVDSVSVNGKPGSVRSFINTGGATNTLQLKSPEGRISQVTVDALGRVMAVAAPGVQAVEYMRDTHGRVLTRKQKNRIWSFGYDPSGRLSFVRDTLGRMTQFKYDAADRDTQQILPDGRAVGFRYDLVGNLVSLHPPGTPLHEFTYKKTDFNTRYMPPALVGVDSTASRFEYNKDGQLTRMVRADGADVNLSYNSQKGRLDAITIARGVLNLGYSSTTGQVTSITSPDGVTLTYGYDGPLVTSEQWSGGIPGSQAVTLGRKYNIDFRDSVETLTSASDISYTYDNDGLLKSAGILTCHRRSVDGAIDSSHVSSISGAIECSLDYDPDYGDLSNLRYRHSTQGVLFQQSLARDVLGRITHLSELAFGTSREWRYSYDNAGRLYGVLLGVGGATPETLATYGYYDNGNRSRVVHFSGNVPMSIDSAHYDLQDRLKDFGTAQVTYTAAGELKTKIASGGATTSFAYDELGNITSVRLATGDSVKYVVDGANRRVGRKLNATWTNGWIYENTLRPAAELDANGAIINRYIYGANGLSPSLLIHGGATYRVITDYLGSVRGIVDIATGAVAQSRTYDPWGELMASTGGSFQSLGYAGGLADTATGLVRFGARDYFPAAGRWTARDPLGFRGGSSSLAEYADNDPVDAVDPTGTTVMSNACFLLRFLTGLGPRAYDYPENSPEVQEFKRSPGGEIMQAYALLLEPGQSAPFKFTTAEAAAFTALVPSEWPNIGTQVAGFRAVITRNEDGSITYAVDNTAGTRSFFYHVLPDAAWKSGPLSSIQQHIEWTEPVSSREHRVWREVTPP